MDANPNATDVSVNGISINEGAKAEKHQQPPKQAGLGVNVYQYNLYNWVSFLMFTSITCITGCHS